MKKVRAILMSLACLCMVISLMAFGTTVTVSAKVRKPVVGIILKNISDPFQSLLGEAMKKKATEYSKDFDYVFVESQSDISKQISQFEELIAQKVAVIICAPQDADGSSKGVELCKKANIPLIIVNSRTNNTSYTAFVGSNDVNAGEIMGNYVNKRLGGKGNVCQLEGGMGNSAQIDRNKGLENTIYKQKDIKLLAKLSANWQRDKAMSITEGWLTTYPKVDAIMCENDDMAMGALQAAEASKRKKGIIIIGVDAIQDALKAVKDGRLDATIFQDAKGQGMKAVEVANAIIAKKGKIEKEYMIPFQLVTKDNVNNFMK
jgi:inositol transport system substrate-binding protein